MRRIRICRDVSFRERDGVYVFYTNFSYIFFKGVASSLIEQLLASMKASGVSLAQGLPDDFVDHLLAKKIVEEVHYDN